MVRLQPKLQFKEIGVDTNEKERQRKLKGQQRWNNYFHEIVVDYFETCNFQTCNFHKGFNPEKDQLDVFVPSYGNLW